MLEPGKITRSGGTSKGSAQKDTLLREASKALIRQGKMWVIASRGAAETGAEGGVEPLAMQADEQADAAVGGRAGQDGQHREQQQVGEAVTPALAAARVGDPVQGGEQAGERHHGGLRCGERSALNGSGAPPVPRPHPTSRTAHLQNRTALLPDG